MDILVKKSSPEDKGFVDSKTLISELNKETEETVSIINDKISILIQDINTIKRDLEFLFLFKKKLDNGSYGLLNLAHLPSLEEDESIKEGTIYYDILNHKLRVKTNNNWKDV